MAGILGQRPPTQPLLKPCIKHRRYKLAIVDTRSCEASVNPLRNGVRVKITKGPPKEPDTSNAEVAYNHYVPRTDRLTNLTPAYKPIGPGAFMHATRNALGMCGMRVFAAPLDEHMRKVIRNPQASRMLSDFVASCLSGAISMPFNQLYNFFFDKTTISNLKRRIVQKGRTSSLQGSSQW
mmetsp:Transcript_6459/g.6388  ORF Transcript_6459/g.6388 Transcript_6459/m.6388 type:complete len:180 (+) Transcript_6459:98-637(+)